jgi:hypothetical protein
MFGYGADFERRVRIEWASGFRISTHVGTRRRASLDYGGSDTGTRTITLEALFQDGA